MERYSSAEATFGSSNISKPLRVKPMITGSLMCGCTVSACSRTFYLLLFLLCIQCLKINWAKQYGRKPTARNQIRYSFASVREKNIGASDADNCFKIFLGNIAYLKNTGLGNFNQKYGFVFDFGGYSD